jgi:TonB family protein
MSIDAKQVVEARNPTHVRMLNARRNYCKHRRRAHGVWRTAFAVSASGIRAGLDQRFGELERVSLKANCAVGFVIMLFVLFGSDMAKGEPTNTCRRGWLLMHSASGYSAHTSPEQWNADLLIRARDAFNRCAKSYPRGSIQRVEGVAGWTQATVSLAEHFHFLSIGVLIYKVKGPEQAFTKLHGIALLLSRNAIAAVAEDETSEFADATDDAEVASRIRDFFTKARARAYDVKHTILSTTYDSLPRNPIELKAYFASDRGAYWGVNQVTGLTAEERCTEPTTAPNVKSSPPEEVSVEPPGAGATQLITRVEVAVNGDGSIRAVHIARSSGNEEHDETAMDKAYRTTFVPARRRCKNVTGVITLEY